MSLIGQNINNQSKAIWYAFPLTKTDSIIVNDCASQVIKIMSKRDSARIL